MKPVLMCRVFLIALISFCGTDEEPGTRPSTRDRIVGTWDWGPFALPPLMPETLSLYIALEEDQTYRMEAFQMGVSALIHSGTWSIAGDTITFNGAQCSALDSLSGEMKAFNCETPISFAVEIVDGLWRIPQNMLLPVIEATNPDLVDKLSVLLQGLSLVKR